MRESVKKFDTPPAGITGVHRPAPFTAPDPIYVDADVLVLDKPGGLLAVPGRGADRQDCLAVRAHLAALGHPVLGDALYAPPTVRAQAQAPRLLHACALGFAHPRTGVLLASERTAPF